MEEDWCIIYENLASYITTLSGKEKDASPEEAADVILVLDIYISVLSTIVQRMSDDSDFDEEEYGSRLKQEIVDLIALLTNILSVWIDKEAGINSAASNQGLIPRGIIIQHHCVGVVVLNLLYLSITYSFCGNFDLVGHK